MDWKECIKWIEDTNAEVRVDQRNKNSSLNGIKITTRM